MDQWIWPRLEPHCSIMHTSCTLFKPKLQDSTPRWLGGCWISLFDSLSTMATLITSPFSAFHYDLSFLLVYWGWVAEDSFLGLPEPRLLHEKLQQCNSCWEGILSEHREAWVSRNSLANTFLEEAEVTWGNESFIGQNSIQASYIKTGSKQSFQLCVQDSVNNIASICWAHNTFEHSDKEL